jgi:hypothetical protein
VGLSHLLILSIVPDDAWEVRSVQPFATLALDNFVAERVTKQCLDQELIGKGGKPGGPKGAVGEHTAISADEESPKLLLSTGKGPKKISDCPWRKGAVLTGEAWGRGWGRRSPGTH